jgi:hypothetical protein
MGLDTGLPVWRKPHLLCCPHWIDLVGSCEPGNKRDVQALFEEVRKVFLLFEEENFFRKNSKRRKAKKVAL